MLRVVLVLLTVACACNAEPAAAPVAEPPTGEFSFPADAATTRYTFFDETGAPVVVGTADEVPTHLRSHAGVLVANQPAPAKGHIYHWLPGAGSRVGTAVLTPSDRLQRDSVAAWAGHIVSMASWETALAVARKDGRGHPRAALSGGRSKDHRVQPGTRTARAPIEIVGINSPAPPQQKRGRAKKTEPELAVWGWHDVTIYYTKTCGRCLSAMNWMNANNVPFRSLDVNTPEGRRESSAVARRARVGNGVPMFVIGPDRKVLKGWHKDRFIAMAKKR